MDSFLNYDDLKEQTLSSTTEDDEAVTVNMRALVDKMLARYSHANAMFRELVQNAEDAGASNIAIRYESRHVKHLQDGEAIQREQIIDSRSILSRKYYRVVVQNNGAIFNDADWDRLKRIAEGNPDETKIGAFGVGFYSVFSMSDSPLVISGRSSLTYFWRGNSLYTRKSILQKSHPTTIVLDFREESSIPSLHVLSDYLASSMVFTNLRDLQLTIDDLKVCHFEKEVGAAQIIKPKFLLPASIPGNLMSLTGVTEQTCKIKGTYINVAAYSADPNPPIRPPKNSGADSPASEGGLRGVFQKVSRAIETTYDRQSRQQLRELQKREEQIWNEEQERLSELEIETCRCIEYNITTASVDVKTTRHFDDELERATKKRPPKGTSISILTLHPEEHRRVQHEASTIKFEDVFATVFPERGRLFIGFPTGQTTGRSVHLSAPNIIPTVERESIDLNSKAIGSWNQALLACAGIVSRLVYDINMSNVVIKEKADAIAESAFFMNSLIVSSATTPDAQVGKIMDSSFWTAQVHGEDIEVFSSAGVLGASQVRLGSTLKFLKEEQLPLIPSELESEAAVPIALLERRGLLRSVDADDVRVVLSNWPLNEKQFTHLISWVGQQLEEPNVSERSVRRTLESAIILCDQSLPVSLGSISQFPNTSWTWPECPLPEPSCLPYRLMARITKANAEALGWNELKVLDWFDNIAALFQDGPLRPSMDAGESEISDFLARVLSVCSRHFNELGQKEKETVIQRLQSRQCIPTTRGFVRPTEAYANNVKLFDDLPVVRHIQGVRQAFLLELGVRKTVELPLVFSRLRQDSVEAKTDTDASTKSSNLTSRNWSHVELVKYLTGIQQDIPKNDLMQLRQTKFCRAVVEFGQLYRLCDMFEPNDQLSALGLPVIQWPGKIPWAESKFMRHLGLKIKPTLADIAACMASEDTATWEAGIQYYLSSYFVNGYSGRELRLLNPRIIPVKTSGGGTDTRSRPTECYGNPISAKFGLAVLRTDLQPNAEKLGVSLDPMIDLCVEHLIRRPPQSQNEAVELFAHMAQRAGELQLRHTGRLVAQPIIPIKLSGDATVRHVNARSCYISIGPSQYRSVFDFVDFGAGANTFLALLGVKPEPTSAEIAEMLVTRGEGFYQSIGESKYIRTLKTLGEHISDLGKMPGLLGKMRHMPFLVGHKHIRAPSDSNDDDDRDSRVSKLVAATEVYIHDDVVLANYFKYDVYLAPQDDSLEDFYRTLEVRSLGQVIEKRFQFGSSYQVTPRSQQLLALVVERFRIFCEYNSEKGLRRDWKWLEKHLVSQEVKKITLTRKFKPSGKIVSHSTTAATPASLDGKEYVLVVTPEPSLFDVSDCIIGLTINNPKPHNSILLEALLRQDLRTLQSRGYNVKRILRAREVAEAKEEEERQKRLEEQRQTKDKEETDRQQLLKGSEIVKSEIRTSRPGDFPDSPPRRPMKEENQLLKTDAVPSTNRHRTGFSSFFRNPFGFPSTPNLSTGFHPIPIDLLHGGTQIDAPGIPQPTPNAESVTSPQKLNGTLQKAIQASQATLQSDIFTRPEIQHVREERSYCDETPGHDLKYVMESVGLKVFCSRDVDNDQFVTENLLAISDFGKLLVEIARVFSLGRQVLNIFYDCEGGTIAFNRNGSLFFNLRFFLQLHLPTFSDNAHGELGPGKKISIVYWYIVMCHELAHNIVQEHSSQHSFYSEMFAMEYFFSIADLITDYEASAVSRVDPSAGQTTPNKKPPKYEAASGQRWT